MTKDKQYTLYLKHKEFNKQLMWNELRRTPIDFTGVNEAGHNRAQLQQAFMDAKIAMERLGKALKHP